jgi:hypothetical protein
MKKKSIFFSISIALVAVILTTGCSFLSSVEPLNKPTGVFVAGNAVFWNKVTNATDYNIYKDDVLLASTDNRYYVIEELTSDVFISVQAADENGKNSDSKKSDAIIMLKNTNFSTDEIINITLDNDIVYEIESSINKVVLSMQTNYESVNNVQIKILDREKDLTIELNDVVIYGPNNEPVISNYIKSVIYTNAPYTVNFVVHGDNEIYSGQAVGVPPKPAENTQTKGGNGYNGQDAVLLSQANFMGTGNLSLHGSDGGQGGVGSDSSGISTAVYGWGGDGGDGGNGLNCSKYVLNLSAASTLSGKAGNGGTGGSPGNNGSVISGPFNTAEWSNRFGAKGYDGLPFSGTEYIISGQKTTI